MKRPTNFFFKKKFCWISDFVKSEKVLETDARSKNMKPLWKVKGFEQHISWNVRVPDCVVS